MLLLVLKRTVLMRRYVSVAPLQNECEIKLLDKVILIIIKNKGSRIRILKFKYISNSVFRSYVSDVEKLTGCK